MKKLISILYVLKAPALSIGLKTNRQIVGTNMQHQSQTADRQNVDLQIMQFDAIEMVLFQYRKVLTTKLEIVFGRLIEMLESVNKKS